jgi:hypothetical protein
MKAIAVLLLVVSLILHPYVGHAAWQPNGNGVAVVAGDQGVPTICPDGKGGTIIAWSDNRSGSYDIYAQRLDGLGVAQWASNGVVVCSAPGDQVNPQIISDDNYGAIVTWEDTRNGNPDIFAQRVDTSGNSLWSPNGLALCTDISMQHAPTLVSDGAQGAIVVWTDQRNGGANKDIYAQRVNSGVVQWTANGVPVDADVSDQFNPTVVTDGAGGAIVTFENQGSDIDVYAEHLNAANGASMWAKKAVCTASGDQTHTAATSDLAGGVIVAWDDRRGGGNTDIYAQRLNASGSPLWTANGAALCTASFDQIAPQIVSSTIGGAIVAWSDQRSDPGDIYAQRVNGSGSAQWTLNGVVVCTAPGEQTFHPRSSEIATDGAGGAFVTWEDLRTGPTDIYGQQVTFQNGAVKLTSSGAPLCTAVGQQVLPVITYTGPFGDAVVTWADERNEGANVHDVYALPVPNTPIGPFVRYVPYPNGLVPPPPRLPVHVLFHNVIGPGFTYLDITPAGPALPPSFVLGDGRYYNLSTTAATTDNIDVCIKFDPAALQHPAAALRMFEYNVAGPAGPTWLDVTTMPAAGDSICGTSTTLSTFVIGFPSVTGVGDTPASFALHANVPNPFNPLTTIRYDVPGGGADVNISIYDVSGQLIRSLVNEHRGAGTWSVQWNGDDDRGQSVASGVYFYRMRAGEFVETKKMMLLK